MKQVSLVGLLALFIIFFPSQCKSNSFASPTSPTQQAEWTLMFYVDADNNLEEDALIDFNEMARVGSTDQVNVVVQMDRIGKYVPQTDTRYPFWTDTLRFRITKGMKPAPENALKDRIGEANMGDGKTLADFVSWSKKMFPARRYALIIWDHGQGWRGVLPPTEAVRAMATQSGLDPLSQPLVGDMRLGFPFRTPIGSPYRSLSYDETNKDKLYNREIQDSLKNILKEEKLDLLGFDACLMAMLETAYAMRDVAKVFVGSEELEPGSGWQYDEWLDMLVNNPKMDGQALGKVLVDSFRNAYGATENKEANRTTTLSAVDLSKVNQLADATTVLSKSLIQKFSSEKENIKAARDECFVYAPDALGDKHDYFLHIDLARFCERLIVHVRDQDLKKQAKVVRDLIEASVLRNYAGADRLGSFGSNGLAVYFPPDGATYCKDFLTEGGYENSRTKPGQPAPPFPVEFVETHYWADFLHVYFDNFK